MSTVIKNVIFKDISQFIHKENGFLAYELLSCLVESKELEVSFRLLALPHLHSEMLVRKERADNGMELKSAER